MSELSFYTVPDWLPQGDGLRVVFVLESPYSSEIVHKHPLAGESGQSVTEWLSKNILEEFGDWNTDVPFGCHLKSKNYTKLGLMNCSLLPLDKSVYSCSQRLSDGEKLAGMDLIRKNPKSQDRKDARHTVTEQEILTNLTSRLAKLAASVLIVPCGIVARTMVSKTQTTLTIYPGEVPHPSRNQWSAKNNQTVMRILANVLRNRLCPTPE